MHGIEMAGDQDAGLALFRMGKAGTHAAGKTLPSGDALDRRTHDRHVARGEIEHPLHRARIPCRTLAFDPGAQSLQHGLGVEREICRIHGRILLVFS